MRISPSAYKQMRKIPKKDLQKIFKKIHEIEANPILGKQLTGNLKKHYSYRSWPYRIIYQIFKQEKTIPIYIKQSDCNFKYKKDVIIYLRATKSLIDKLKDVEDLNEHMPVLDVNKK